MGLEKFFSGQFSLSAEDERRIRAQAESAGEDPEKALHEAKQKMEGATKTLHRKQGEEARRKLEEDLEKQDRKAA